jgi:hypothetical protein
VDKGGDGKMSDGMRREELEVKEAQRAHDRVNELEDQLNDGAMKAADLALRTLIAINGAAIVSLLAFTGSLLGRDVTYKAKISPMIDSFWWFGGGMATAALAMLFIILAFFVGGLNHHFRDRTFRYPYFNPTRLSAILETVSYGFLLIAVALGVGSLVVFIKGCMVVHDVLVSLTT